VAGQDAEEAVLNRGIRRPGRAGRPWWPARRPGAGVLLAFLPTLALAAGFWLCLPSRLFDVPYSTVLLDRDGRLLGATIAADGQWRFPADRELSAKFVQALVVREDKRFFRHPGVDPCAIARALVSNVRRREVVSGGSTITMQVIRLSRGKQPRILGEKLVEALLSLRLSLSVTKPGVLRLFASNAPFGGNVVGFEAASWRWFGRDPDTLSWAECAALAVLPNSPGLVHPGRNRDALLERRNGLLDELARRGVIDADTQRLAKAEPLPQEPFPLPQCAPHLLVRARTEAVGAADGDGAGTAAGGATAGGARIRTTLDRGLQKRLNDIMARHAQSWRESGVANGAALVLDVRTGAVLAYAGNVPAGNRADDAVTDEPAADGGQVDIVTASRSTGSLLKPFLYAAMLDAGELMPEQIVPDIPTRMGGFIPENNTRTFSGAVPANVALAHSLNVPMVRLLRSFGVERFQQALTAIGMTTLFRPSRDYGLALVVGGAEGTLWDLTGMYAGLARSALREPAGGGAAFFPPHYLADGAAGGAGASQGATDGPGAGACWLALQALLEVVRPGEEGAWREFLGSRKVAWKTGTSYGFRDAWAIGVTPRHAVGVWVGNASGEGRPELKGSTSAAPVLFDVFGLLGTSSWFAMPESDLAEIETCAKSGLRAGPWCAETRLTRVPPAALASATLCGYCRLVHLDRTGRFRASTRTESMGSLAAVKWFVLPAAMEWYYRRSHADYRPLPPFAPGETPTELPSASLGFVFPEQGGTIYIPIELDGAPGRTVFRAVHRDSRATIFWHLDGAYLGETTELHDIEARPGIGKHVLTIVDGNGEEVVRTFTCLSEE
jgi:penicillin-binding protein 1C